MIDLRNRSFARCLPGLFALGIVASGCTRSNPGDQSANGGVSTSAVSAAKADPPKSASDLLDRMARAYREAKSYADAGKLKFSCALDGQQSAEEVDFSIAFVRPSLLRAHIYQAIIVADGKKLHATISDLPGQVLESEMTETLKPDDLMQDQTLGQVLSEGIGGESPQLALLLHENALAPMLEGSESTKLLESMEIDGAPCYQVEVVRPDGRLVFFIDEQTSALRRILYPVKGLADQLSKEGNYTNVELVANFTGAKLNGEIDPVAFKFESPGEAQIVAQFDASAAAPNSAAASNNAAQLLGRQIPEFTLQSLDGKPVSRESLSGKVVVLDFWFATCTYCFEQLPELQKVYEKYRDDPRVVFAAVNVDDPATPASEVQAAFNKSSSTIPVVRDTANHAEQTFQVAGYPSLYVLDGKGAVQIAHTGVNKQLATELPQKLDALLAGKDIYQDEIRALEAKAQEQGGGVGTQELPPATIAEKSSPQKLRLTPLWTNDEQAQPGNIVAVTDAAGKTRFVVNDAWNAIVELDGAGKKLLRREFELPQNAIISFIHQATDAAGRRYYVGSTSAVNQQQIYLFDENWNKLLAFPDTEHAGIADVQLADLNGDGELEINVSYWGVVGVQNVSLSGNRNWSNRTMENVFRLAATGKDASGKRMLWCANGRGTLAPIDADGKEKEHVVVDGRYVRAIFVEDLNGDDRPEFAALAVNQEGVETLLGLSEQGKELWRHELPRGQYQAPVEPVAAGALTTDAEKQWIVAGPDGSLHVLDADGTLVDRFNHGSVITGFAAAKVDGKPVLVVSSGKTVEAWSVESTAP